MWLDVMEELLSQFAFLYFADYTQTMKIFFYELLKYNPYANIAFIRVISEQKFREEAKKLFSHILNAHHIWRARMANKLPMFIRRKNHQVDCFTEIDQNNHHLCFGLTHELNDYDKDVNIEN